MKRLILTSMIALLVLAGPTAMQLRADDAHHPEKAAKAKKPTKAKPKPRQRKPAAKTGQSQQNEMTVGWVERKTLTTQ